MNRIEFAIILVMCVLLINCKKETLQENKDLIIISKDKVITIKKLAFDDVRFVDSCIFIPLETSDAGLLGEITQIEFCKDKYYIWDRKTEKLKVFSSTGKFLFDIGTQGQGAEEYVAIRSFFINEKEGKVGIFDPVKLAVHEYSLNGKFLQTIKHGQKMFVRKAIGMDGYIYCSFDNSHVNDMVYSKLSAKNYSIIDQWSSYKVQVETPMVNILARHPFSIINDEVHHISLYSDTIYSYKDGEDKPYLLIETDKPNIPLNYFEGKPFEYEPSKALLEVWKDKRYSPGFTDLFETDRYIITSFYFNKDFYIIDKDNNETFHILEPEESLLNFVLSISVNENKLIKVFDSEQISQYQDNIKNLGTEYPEQIRELMTNYDPDEDNPVLIVYYMKRSTK